MSARGQPGWICTLFEQFVERLNTALRPLIGQKRLSEENIADAVREVRKALLEADVALPVIQEFIAEVRQLAMGEEVLDSLNPGQTFVGIVQKALTKALGEANVGLELAAPPAVVLLAGLQGSGKTTTAVKIAHHMRTRLNKSVSLTSVDVYRPGAIQQLRDLATEAALDYLDTGIEGDPVAMARAAKQAAIGKLADVLLVDTAGRLAIDDQMMAEIRDLHQVLQPTETLFVVDAMMGQDAARVAAAFGAALPLTGIILTKVDGDARGGAALSVRHIVGKPIKFMGVGEKIDALEAFHPDRIASRLLGMGDLLSLIEAAEHKLDRAKTERMERILREGTGFDLYDLRDQIQQMNSLGGVGALLEKFPTLGNLIPGIGNEMSTRQLSAILEPSVGEEAVRKMLTAINSMTDAERRRPEIIQGSRKARIARGAGLQIQDVNRVLKHHRTMSKAAAKVAGVKPQSMTARIMGAVMRPKKRRKPAARRRTRRR